MNWIIWVLLIAFLFAVGLGGAFWIPLILILIVFEILGIIVMLGLSDDYQKFACLVGILLIIVIICTVTFLLIPNFNSLITWIKVNIPKIIKIFK